MAKKSTFSSTFTSHSGSDIRAVFGGRQIGTIQGISYSITREVAPIYVMGSPSPVSYSRGKRGIGGSLVFVAFDRHALSDAMRDSKFAAWKDEVRSDDDRKAAFAGGSSVQIQDFLGISKNTQAIAAPYPNLSIQGFDGDNINPRSGKINTNPWYSDQLPAFDIVLMGANEHGAATTMTIYGVQIISEGSGVSIDDVVLESQMGFVARDVRHWAPFGEFTDPNVT